nr:hypothetical protein [uncultured Rhodopila sp.]
MWIVFYLVLCFLTALAGRQRRIGFLGTLILSVVVTPLLVASVFLITKQNAPRLKMAGGRVAACPYCGNAATGGSARYCPNCGRALVS